MNEVKLKYDKNINKNMRSLLYWENKNSGKLGKKRNAYYKYLFIHSQEINYTVTSDKLSIFHSSVYLISIFYSAHFSQRKQLKCRAHTEVLHSKDICRIFLENVHQQNINMLKIKGGGGYEFFPKYDHCCDS